MTPIPARTRIALDAQGASARLRMVPPPGKPPTLDHEVLREFEACLEALEAAPPRLLVLESGSPGAFCAGANLEVLRGLDSTSIVPWVEAGHRVLARLEDLPFPVIARVEGFALGGGLELALACDLIFASPAAKLGLTEARMGFVPGWGGSFRLPERIGLPAAKRMFFQATMVDAEEALRIGLSDFVGDPPALDQEIAKMLSSLEELSPGALAGFKKLTSESRRSFREANAGAEAIASVDCLRSSDTQHRITAFLNRKK